MLSYVIVWNKSLRWPPQLQCFRHRTVRKGRLHVQVFSDRAKARTFAKSMRQQGYCTKLAYTILDWPAVKIPQATRPLTRHVRRTFIQNLTAQELASRRYALGLTQAQLGERLGVAGNTVTRWEMGMRRRIPAMVAQVLDVLEQGAYPSTPS